jgi:hypothetical protein
MSQTCQFRTHATHQISLPRLSIGCAITGLIATAVSNHAGRPADIYSNADSWVAKSSQAVQYRRDRTVNARRTVTCCQTTNAGSC